MLFGFSLQFVIKVTQIPLKILVCPPLSWGYCPTLYGSSSSTPKPFIASKQL